METNRKAIAASLVKDGDSIGIYDTIIDEFSAVTVKRVTDALGFGNTALSAQLDGVRYVISIRYIDDEVDITAKERSA